MEEINTEEITESLNRTMNNIKVAKTKGNEFLDYCTRAVIRWMDIFTNTTVDYLDVRTDCTMPYECKMTCCDYRFYFIQDIKYKEVAMDVYKLEYTGVMTL
jgi:hypothetical protein